jgi:hypothetical protein
VSVKPTLDELLALVGNPAVYAVQREDGSWEPVREKLTRSVLRRHLAGEVTVGTYIVKPPDQARTLVFDIDAPEEEQQQAMLSAVLDALGAAGLSGAVEFSGRKGYHVWVVVSDYVPAALLYQIGRGLRVEAGLPDLEVFPKQTEVRDLGNLVKVPGGVHRVTGKENNWITYGHSLWNKDLLTPTEVEAAAKLYPEVSLRRKSAAEFETIEYPCVHGVQEGVTEGGRNNSLFHLAVMLRRWSLTDENVEAVVRRSNERADPPLPDAEVDALLESSRHSGPICDQLPEALQCGEQCVKTRHKGLYTRAGALRWAGEGEVVTVEISGRNESGTVVELAHPDLIQGKAVLAEPNLKKGGKRD